MRFPAFDHTRKPSIEVVGGVPTICSDREVLAEHGVIEPLDERTDSFVSVPIRSVHTPGSGVSLEIGPFSLTTGDIVQLHNMIADHINSTSGEFRIRSEES